MTGIDILKYNKIVISRTDNIGDVILSLPLAYYLKKLNPNVFIAFIGKSYTSGIIRNCKYVDKVINADDIQTTEWVKVLTGFDVILHAFPNKVIEKASSLAKIPYRVTFSRKLRNMFYSNKNMNFSRRGSDLHESQLNLKMAKIFSGFEIPDISDVKQLTLLKPEGIANKQKRVILHTKSKGSAVEWKMEHFRKLALKLADAGYQVVYTGTPNEQEEIIPFIPNHENIINMVGKLTLDELIVFIAESESLVAASTGPLHIAASAGIRSVGLFVPKRPMHPGRWGAIGPKAVNLVYDDNCDVCKRGELHDCINMIDPERVFLELTK